MRVSSHELDIYGTGIHLVTEKKDCVAFADLFGGVEGFDGESLGTTASCINEKTGKFHVIFYVDRRALRNKRHNLVDTVAHEAVHGAGAIAQHLGLDTDDPSSEHFAYLVGFIAGWIYREATAPQEQEDWDDE